MFGLATGPTVLRQTVSRIISGANTDWVMMAQPIPPGSTVNQISLDWTLTSKHSMDTWKWHSYTLHGVFLGFPNPNHGFGNSMANYDTMWDNYVPKDLDPALSMEDWTNDSHPDSSMTSTGQTDTQAIESGNLGTHFGYASGQIITVEDAPEVFFAREENLDVTNGIVVDSDGDAGKFIAVDKYKGQLNKNYHLSKDRYWFALMGVGFPHIEASNAAWDFHPDTEAEWLHLAYPELSLIEGLITSGEDQGALEGVRRQLETYYIDQDTGHDLDESDGPNEHVCTLKSTINYRRPKFEGVQLNADAGGF